MFSFTARNVIFHNHNYIFVLKFMNVLVLVLITG
jgi:hypothetical protein